MTLGVGAGVAAAGLSERRSAEQRSAHSVIGA
jgi:hypothetical protein